MNRSHVAIALLPALLLIAADGPPSAAPTGSGKGDSPSAGSAGTARVAPTKRGAWHNHKRGRSHSLALDRLDAANRSATREPGGAAFLNALQVYAFSEGMIYHVYTAPERVTDIALQPGEALGAVAAGDTARWVIGDTTSGSGETKRVHVLVKPFAAGLASNLVITTDRRTYHLALTSTGGAATAALSWTYPQEQLIALKKADAQAQPAQPAAPALSVEQMHFNYSISGDAPRWRPLRAFDDGQQTFIEFPASITNGEAPPLFVLDGRGQAELVNYRVRGRFYVVDRLFDAAELRLGLKHQDVVRISRVAESAGRERAS